MSEALSKQVAELLGKPGTITVLAAVGKTGEPHSAVNDFVSLNGAGNLVVPEFFENSRLNKNLVHSIWHDKTVSILVKGADSQVFHLRGVPLKVHTSGPVFQEFYVELRKKRPGFDLSGIWIIKIDEILDDSLDARLVREKASDQYDGVLHLDRIAEI